MSHDGTEACCVIWMIDDNPDELEIAEEAVREVGFAGRFHTYASGTATLLALTATAERPETVPDVIIIDVKMPGLDGIELLQRIKAHADHARIPVVMFTTSNAPQDRDRCMRIGAADYVIKPMGFHEFLTLFGELVRTWC